MAAPERKPQLLIFEDAAAAVRQLRWTFDGHEVVEAADRPSALTALRGERFPVALLDLGLPPDAASNPPGNLRPLLRAPLHWWFGPTRQES